MTRLELLPVGSKPLAHLANATVRQIESPGYGTCRLAGNSRLDDLGMTRRQRGKPRRNVDARCSDVGGASVAVFNKDLFPVSGPRIMPVEAFNRWAMNAAGAGGQYILRIHAIADAPPGTDLPQRKLCQGCWIRYSDFAVQHELHERAVRVCDDLLHQFVAGLGAQSTGCDTRLTKDLRKHSQKPLAV